MGYCIVKQPNNLYGIFSSIVDDFIEINLTEDRAFNIVQMEANKTIANTLLSSAKNGRYNFEEMIEAIRETHGKTKAEARRKLLSKDPLKKRKYSNVNIKRYEKIVIQIPLINLKANFIELYTDLISKGYNQVLSGKVFDSNSKYYTMIFEKRLKK